MCTPRIDETEENKIRPFDMNIFAYSKPISKMIEQVNPGTRWVSLARYNKLGVKILYYCFYNSSWDKFRKFRTTRKHGKQLCGFADSIRLSSYIFY